jgi:adenylate cyclase
MAARNAGAQAGRRIDFRIGINLGDIMIDEDDIFGDGVNVAARLEALAEPGGICVSRVVRDQVRDKLAIRFEDMGEQQVKNIARPVRAYRALLAEKADRPSIPSEPAPRPLSDRPSIAVLPFHNVSGDPEQEYFVDGITEDIITALSKWRWFLVIARNSTFAYKGKSVDLKEVGRELGVRYVLEGSMRRAGQRVRISSQLINAATGTHLWAERYDRDLTDIFAVQDEITSRVVAAIEPALSRAESERVIAKRPEHMGLGLLPARVLACAQGHPHRWHHSPRLVQTGTCGRSQSRGRPSGTCPCIDRAVGLWLSRGLGPIRAAGPRIRSSGFGAR